MDARRAVEIGARVLGIFFVLTGAVTLAELFEIVGLPAAVSRYDVARWAGARALAGGVQIVAGVLLFRSEDLSRRLTHRRDGVPDLAVAGVGLTLMGVYFAVRGLVGATQIVAYFGGQTPHARVFATILAGAAVQVVAGMLLMRNATSFAARLGGTEDAREIGAVLIALVGVAAAIVGSAHLAGWLVSTSAIGSYRRSDQLRSLAQPIVTIAFGAILMRAPLRLSSGRT